MTMNEVSEMLLTIAQWYLAIGFVYAIGFWFLRLGGKFPVGATVNDKPVWGPLLLIVILLLMTFFWLPIFLMKDKVKFTEVKSEPRDK